MDNKMEKYRRYIFAGIVIIALGVTFTNTMKETSGSLGVVFIAVGGLFFLIGMNMKKKKDQSEIE